MTTRPARSQTGLYLTPILIVAAVLLVMFIGSLVRESPGTRAEVDAQRIQSMAEQERFHCQMFGVPSDEAQLAGYVCP